MSPENSAYRYLVFACSSRDAETNESIDGEQVREKALKHVFFFKKDLKKFDPIMNFVFQK